MNKITDLDKPVFGSNNQLAESKLLYKKLCEFHNVFCVHLLVKKFHPEFFIGKEDRNMLSRISSGDAYRFRLNGKFVQKAIHVESDNMLLSWRESNNFLRLSIPVRAIIEISGIFVYDREYYVFPWFAKDPSYAYSDRSKRGHANKKYPPLRLV